MKLLITGGAGFIGANFIHYWLKHNPDDEITNLDALTYAGNLENLASIEGDNRYHFIKGDITDVAVVEKAVSGVDKIIHFAAETHVDRSILKPDSFITTNVYGTFTLLEAARKHGVHFHHVSTDEVFGFLPLDSKEMFSEKTPYNPSSPYSASKAGSDHLVRAYFRTYGLPVTMTNCSNNFGPYQFPEKLFALAITNVIEGKPIPIYGEGNQVRDWLYVEDHCRAIELVLSKGKLGETYLIGGQTDDISNLQVAKLILNILNKGDEFIEHVKDRPGHDLRYAVDWSKAKNELGYEPVYPFEINLEKTIQWYLDNQAWWERVKSGEYQNYYKSQYGER